MGLELWVRMGWRGVRLQRELQSCVGVLLLRPGRSGCRVQGECGVPLLGWVSLFLSNFQDLPSSLEGLGWVGGLEPLCVFKGHFGTLESGAANPKRSDSSKLRTSPLVQWLRLHAPNAGGRGSIPAGAQLASIRQMSWQVSWGSAGEYQADERAGVAWLSWRVSGR